ncbi:hypothetical protein NQ314_001569 [Rhamnusium bicolor]|uniref:Uncharacterized protein n=1 Tax=Rhamnusium bicolor TaxID=1586634 RepID=A0AAV8ZV28_9CUCU|nr:hypothetical protein NQ314_001569 [Rhamnusium bicolor]
MKKDCPKYDKLYDEIASSDYFKNIPLENKDLFDYIAKHTGWNVTTLSNVGTLQDVFYVYRNHNVSYVPAWADDLDQQKLNYLAGIDFKKGNIYR